MRFVVSVFCVFLSVALVTLPALSEESGRLEGAVVSRETAEPLAWANIVLTETVLGTASMADGSFFLDGIPPGSYRVKTTRIGYAPGVHEIRIRSGETTFIEVMLEETSIPISEVVVSAGRVEQTLAETPGSVSVIGRETLEERAATSLEHVLPMVSGVDLPFGQVSIRGSTGYNRGAGSRVLFLVDGFPTITGDTGGINWDLVPLWEIERVEVVKGAGSALYGSNAMGGVINVITRAPSGRPWTRLSLHGGWYGEPAYPEWRWTDERLYFSGIDGVHSRQVGKARVLLGAGERQSQGYRQNNWERRYRSMARLEVDHNPRMKSEMFFSLGRMTYGFFQEWWDQSLALFVRPETRGDRVRSDKMTLGGKMTWTPSESVVVTVRPSWYRTRWRDFFHSGDQFSDADKIVLETQVHKTIGARHLLISGIDLGHNTIGSNMFGDHKARRVAAFVQDEIRATSTLNATLGLRWDGYGVEDGASENEVSPKLAAVWRQSPDLSLRVSVSRGFRAPSLAERFTRTTISGISVFPNPDLRAESVWSGEIGMLRGLGRRGLVSAAVFESRYEDLVQVGGGLDSLMFSNTHRARVRGLDLELTFRPVGGFSGKVAYCYQDHVNRDTGEPLFYRSKHSVTTSLDLRKDPFSVGADVRYQSKVDAVQAFPLDERVPLYLANLRSALSIGYVTFTFKIDNLLEYHYTPIERNLGPIRNYTFGVMADL